MPLLEIRDLRIEFGRGTDSVRAVDGVSLALDAGRALCLVGESGSGKSLTALSIARLLPTPSARIVGGTVLVEGRDVLGMNAAQLRELRGRLVSYVFQDASASLHPAATIRSQIRESLRLHRPEADDDREVVRLLRRVGIPDPEHRLHAYPHELSGGMQQRVMIAIAIAPRPRLLVADEPTSALDVTVQAQIIELLRSLKEEYGMALFLITHHLGLVADIADRMVVMYAGQVVESGPSAKLLGSPAHPYTEALLRSVPRLDLETPRLAAIPGSVPAPRAFPAGCRFHPRCPKAVAECARHMPELRPLPSSEVLARCPLQP